MKITKQKKRGKPSLFYYLLLNSVIYSCTANWLL